MRSIQEIFNAVIESGVYTDHRPYSGSTLMCIALLYSVDLGAITEEEKKIASKEIKNRIDPWPSLFLYLNAQEKPSDFDSRVEYYRSWNEH